MVEVRRMRYFIAVAEELHFTRAALRLHIAQPALSQQIRELEREVGVELLVRSKHSVRLTEAGRVFLDHVRKIVDEVDGARLAAQRANRGDVGRMVVSFIPSAAGDLIPATVRSYRASFPEVEIVLRELNTADQIAGLLHHELHLGLTHDNFAPDRLASEIVRHEPFVVALPSGHALAAQESIALEQLAGEAFVVGPNSSADSRYASVVSDACAKAGFVPSVVHQAVSPATRHVLIASGFGIALIVASARHLRSDDIVYRPLEQPLTVPLHALWPKDLHSPLVDKLLVILRACAAAQPALHPDPRTEAARNAEA